MVLGRYSVHEGFAADGQAALGQLVEPIGDVQQRVPLAQLQERPWPAAILGRHPPSPTDAAWVESARLERQDLFDAYIVLPAVGEVVLVHEALSRT